MRTQTAPTTRLKNYTPPAFQITTVDLNISLDPLNTIVRATLKVVRGRKTRAGTPLVLDGDELSLVSVALDGIELEKSGIRSSPQKLEIITTPRAREFTVEIITRLAPQNNRKLMGLYLSSGVYCTQCEAEGFRRITYFLDRPDVLSVYTVRLEADRAACPRLMSNGNPVKKGKLKGDRHFAVWHDPHPKPCYLFALVGGTLDVVSSKFKTSSGSKVDLNIYVEPGKAGLATFAMDALKRSMTWDEEVYGCEYDLDVFNIVAVSDFNMGAMENKGLNIFNDKYVLASSQLATDTDTMHIEAIIAHEYFHNWTGNRITCRDWFQLCLKEGLTVYRDQEFSADQRSRAVQRIQQVRTLKAAQFAEDAGPLAHPVRPGAYKEINNFYTATVYQKGAELVRMLATLVGPKTYRKATDLYFKRHDGEAAVVEDFLKCFADAAKMDLSQFARWYAQAGTPVVDVAESYDAKKQRYSLTFTQSVPPTPNQLRKQTVPIPIRFGLLDKTGADMQIKTRSLAVRDDLIILTKRKTKVVFDEVAARPHPSLLRGFSAPVVLNFRESEKALMLRARYDSDLYNRWEACNRFAMQILTDAAKGKSGRRIDEKHTDFNELVTALALDDTLEPEFRSQLLTLPSNHDIARQIGTNVDPDAVARVRDQIQSRLGSCLGAGGLKLVKSLQKAEAASSQLEAAGQRALKNAILPLLVRGGVDGSLKQAQSQFSKAANMTDHIAALNILVHSQSNSKITNAALEKFQSRYKKIPLVIDKWLVVQGIIAGKRGLQKVRKLVTSDVFTFDNPNRARSLLGAFASGNLTGFHSADGAGYKFYADMIIKLDTINPQVAARLLTLMGNWKSMEKNRRQKAKLELRRIAATPALSRDVQEIVDRFLQP